MDVSYEEAVERDDLLGILRALALGADINEILGVIECPPEAIVRCLDQDKTPAVVSAPASAPRAMRCSALHIAAYHGHVSSAELLLLNGARKNTRGLFLDNEDTSLSLLGATAEEIAIATGYDDAARYSCGHSGYAGNIRRHNKAEHRQRPKRRALR